MNCIKNHNFSDMENFANLNMGKCCFSNEMAEMNHKVNSYTICHLMHFRIGGGGRARDDPFISTASIFHVIVTA